MMNLFDDYELGACLTIVFGIAASITATAGWLTHVIVCIQDGRCVFLIAGAVAAPVAVIHGIGCWFGWWA